MVRIFGLEFKCFLRFFSHTLAWVWVRSSHSQWFVGDPNKSRGTLVQDFRSWGWYGVHYFSAIRQFFAFFGTLMAVHALWFCVSSRVCGLVAAAQAWQAPLLAAMDMLRALTPPFLKPTFRSCPASFVKQHWPVATSAWP